MKSRLAGAFVLLALFTSACNSSMKKPDIKHNPNPKMGYEITLIIDDAPGPFESVTGLMQYEVANERCAPEHPISGSRHPPLAPVPFSLSRVGDNTYTGTLYLDLLLSEDYFGLGMCHWTMKYASIGMRAGGVTFSAGISGEKISAQASELTYFPKDIYGRDGDIPMGGTPRSRWITDDASKFFTAMLSAKEILE